MPTKDAPSPELNRKNASEQRGPSPPSSVDVEKPRIEPDEPTNNTTDADQNNKTNEDIITAPNPIGNLDGYITTEMYIRLSEAFDGECTRDNDGTHLDREIPDDAIWRERYKSIITCPLSQ